MILKTRSISLDNTLIEIVEQGKRKFDYISVTYIQNNNNNCMKYGEDIIQQMKNNDYCLIYIVHNKRTSIIKCSLNEALESVKNKNLSELPEVDYVEPIRTQPIECNFINEVSTIHASQDLVLEMNERISYKIETIQFKTTHDALITMDSCGFINAHQNIITSSYVSAIINPNTEKRIGGAYTILNNKYNIENFLNEFNEDILSRQNFVFLPKEKYYDCIFSRIVTDMILRELLALVCGDIIRAKQSLFDVNSIGQKFGNLTIYENPHNGINNALYDFESIELTRRPIFENGILCRVITAEQNSNALKQKNTGNNFYYGESLLNLEYENLFPYNTNNFSGLIINDIFNFAVNGNTGAATGSCTGSYFENGRHIGNIENFMISFNILDYCKNVILFDNSNNLYNNGSSLLTSVFVS